MTSIRLRLLLALLAIVPAGLAGDAPARIASVEGITEYRLANGLRVLLFPDRSQSKVTVNMTVLVGSRHEGYGETGMAHLLEHMVFKGTPRHPNVPKALQDHGAQFNGSTSDDRVNYFETLAASDENLEFAIELEADRLVNSLIKREDLDSEMTVVRNEFERGENSPQGVLMERIQSAAYAWHNYGKSTIGNRSDIERVPVENLVAFYRKYYQPDNVVLVVAGRFEEPKALGLVQKHFGPIPPPSRKLDGTWTEEPAQDGERLVTLRRVGEVGMVGVAYHIPAGPHEDTAALQVLANILSTQPSGRLHKALVESGKAASASAFARGEHDPGLLTLQAQVRRGGSLDEVRDILLATAEQVGTNGVTTEELQRAKQQILKNRERAAANTSQIAISLSEWAAQGDWRLYFLHRDRIEQVTPSAVQAAAARYLQRNNRTVGLFIPSEQAERVAIPETPNVNALVAAYQGRASIAEGEAFDATPAQVESRAQRLELPEGIKVTLLPKKTRGAEAHLTLTLRYGNEENLKGFEAAAGFLPDLMLRGTKKLSYQQFRDQLDQLSATLSAGGGGGRRGGRGGGGGGGAPGAATFSIQAKRDTLPAVLELFQQVLREPALPAEEFEVLLRERLASLEQSRSEPAALAPRLLQRLLNSYPADDIRYVPTIDESIGRLRQVTHEKVLQLYRDYLGSQAGELTLVGDFDADACLPILKGMLRGWTAPKPYARIPNPITGEVKPSQHKINTPDKANATFTSGLRFALRDDDADYPALLMGNYILGSGTLSSRLGIRVRQKEGLSYGITSALNASAFDRRAGFTISAICNPQNIGRLEVAVREELDRLLRDGVTQAELDQARQGYLQSQQVSRANDAALGGLLSSLRYEGRTMAQQAAQEESIGTLTATKVNAALRQHLDLAKLVTVTAGDFGGQASSPGSAGERSTGERGASGTAGAASGGPTVAQAGAGTLEARGAEAADVLTPEQKTTGWKLLFNGKDFTGWHSFGTNTVRPGWQVKDGILVCADPKNAGDLCTDEKHDSFELVLDYNITPAGNSGIMYHVTDEGRAAWATGPEVQLEDNQAARDPQRCGWLYALYQPEPDPKTGQPLDATKPAGQWNQIRLVITPEKCEHYVNGVKYFEYVLGSDDFKARVAKSKFGRMPRFAKSPSGYLALQGDHGQVSFRNLKLRALGTGK